MLLDTWRIFATVSVSGGWSSASWTGGWFGANESPGYGEPGTPNGVSGVICPSWSAPATVIALNVDPGS